MLKKAFSVLKRANILNERGREKYNVSDNYYVFVRRFQMIGLFYGVLLALSITGSLFYTIFIYK